SDMVAYYKAQARKERRYKHIEIFDYSISKDYILDKAALIYLAKKGEYKDDYLDRDIFPNENESLVQTKPAKTEEKPAEKPSISDKQANREKIRITMLQATNREKALALAVKLTEEMPDMDYEITSELQSVIQHNKWLGIEIKMPKTPFKGDSDAEVRKSITQLQKAFDGTGYSFNLIRLDKNSVMGQLSFSKDFSTRLNYIRNSKDIWVLFDNNYSNAGSLEFLDPVAKAITKWLNGENVEPFMAGIDPNWDIQFRSIPRVIADKLSAAKEKGENSTSKASTLTESKTINDSKKEDSIQPTSKTPLLDKNNSFMDLVRDGKATAEQFKQSFDDLFANKEAVIAELNTLTKDQLLKKGGYNIQYRYKNDKKSEVAEAVYDSMIAKYALGRGISYGMGKNSYENAVKKMVDDTDQARLDDFAKEYKQMIDDRAKKIAEKAEALKNPQTLEDYRNLVRSKMADGSTRQEAFLSLTPEQRIKYDELEAESTKEAREAKKRALQSTVNTASQTTTGTIIETKHTRDGYDLFVVQL
ncbi:MAG TPA: hypothetical protein PKL69_12725, partial [Agitococcus sp.]|nr:hypothetical protein [Agitococcus sp.]